MAQDAVSWMERLCGSFQSDPNGAEKVLMEFRASEGAIDTSKQILERSRVPMAQFHAAAAIQAAGLMRWETIPAGERAQLRGYLWDFLVHHLGRLDRAVASEVLQTLCVFWKRGWATEPEDARAGLLQTLRGMTTSAHRPHMLLGAQALLVLLGEFTSTSCSSAGVALPLELHRDAHRAFGAWGLDQTLALAMDLLNSVVNPTEQRADGQRDPALHELTGVVVRLCTEVLAWEFREINVWQIPTGQERIDPGPRWREYLVRPDFLEAVFRVYHQVRLDWGRGRDLPHAILQLILNLSSLHGSIFADEGQEAAYASLLVQGTSDILANPVSAAAQLNGAGEHQGGLQQAVQEAQAEEYAGVSSIAVRLISNFKLRLLARLPAFSGFIQRVAALTDQVLREASEASSHGLEGEQHWRVECFDLLLEGWVLIVQDDAVATDLRPQGPLSSPPGGGPGDLGGAQLRAALEELTWPLYQQYVHHRLAISQLEAERTVAQEEDEEDEEIGQVDLQEQLASVACLGRLSPPRALELLTLRLTDVSQRLFHMMSTRSINGQPAITPDGLMAPAASGLLEEAHTAVVLAGHLIADDDPGESAVIPEVLQACFLVDQQASQLLVNMVGAMAAMLDFEVKRLEAGGAGAPDDLLLSPYLSDALLCAFTRWSRSYLVPDTDLYMDNTISHVLTDAFGMAGSAPTLASDPFHKPPSATPQNGGPAPCNQPPGAVQLVDFLLGACWTFLNVWHGQPDVCRNALDLMGVLVSANVAPVTAGLPRWTDMVQSHAKDHHTPPGTASAGAPGFRLLSADLRASLVQRLCQGMLLGGGEGSGPAQGFGKVACPIQARFQALLHAAGQLTGTQRQSPEVVTESELCVALYRGVVRATDSAHHSVVGDFVEPAFDGMVRLLSMHIAGAESVVYEVLQFFRDVAEVQLPFMSGRRALALYEACGKALKIHSDQHTGRREVDPTAEEDSHNDVLCVLQLLSHLASKDLVDISDDGTDARTQGLQVAVSDVVFFGLGRALPLMTKGLLQFPPLAAQYFSLVSFVVGVYSKKMAALEPELFQQLLQSLVFGSHQADATVARNSLQAMADLVTFHVKDITAGGSGLMQQRERNPGIFLELLQPLLHMAVFQAAVWDRLEECAMAVLPIIICECDGFQKLARELVEQQPPAVQPRLSQLFEQLVSAQGLQLALDRQNKKKFRDNFKTFVSFARPVLVSK